MNLMFLHALSSNLFYLGRKWELFVSFVNLSLKMNFGIFFREMFLKYKNFCK